MGAVVLEGGLVGGADLAAAGAEAELARVEVAGQGQGATLFAAAVAGIEERPVLRGWRAAWAEGAASRPRAGCGAELPSAEGEVGNEGGAHPSAGGSSAVGAVWRRAGYLMK